MSARAPRGCGKNPTPRAAFPFDRRAAVGYPNTMRSGPSPLRVAAWLLLPGAVLIAGEPIRFSGRSGPAQSRELVERAPLLPTEARNDRVVTRPDLPMDTFLVPGQAITPTTGLTRRQMEEQERRRNWLQQSPESIQQDASKSESDRAREARDDQRDRGERDNSADGKSPSGRQLNDPDGAGDSARNRNPGPARKAEGNRPAPRTGESGQDNDQRARTGWEPRSSANVRGGPGDSGWFGAGDARGGGVGRMFSDARERERERERAASLDDFKRTFANPWAQTAGGVNPAGGRGPAPAAGLSVPGGDFRRTTAGGLAPGGRAGMELGARGGLGDFDPKNPLNYGAAGTVLRQPEPPRTLDRKPIVLEVPKRKF